jgi:hypothetical protein
MVCRDLAGEGNIRSRVDGMRYVWRGYRVCAVCWGKGYGSNGRIDPN